MANEFKRNVGSRVDKRDAMGWIDKYDQEIRTHKEKDPKSIFFGKDVLHEILSHHECTGISFFFGLKHNDHAKKETVQLVLIGTREDGSLIWPEQTAGKDGGSVGAGTYDNGLACPPYCPK